MITTLLLFVVLAAVGVVPAAFLYLRREPAAPGRGLLLGLRAAALLLVALLLVDPTLPWDEAAGAPEPHRWVLVDGSRALDVPHPDGGTLRDHAVERATREAREGARLALAGPEPEGVDTLALAQAAPRLPVRDLRPSLVRLAEAGADSIVLLSSLRTSAAALERALEGLPVPVRVERLGEPVRNAGVLELELPGRVAADETVRGGLTLFGEGGEEGDSLWVRLEEGEREVERRRVALPRAGEPHRLALELPPPADTGMVRYRASVELEGDVFRMDDQRVRHVRVGPPEGGIVLVSLEPDWEPRVLLPILEAATGLDGEGYLQVGDDAWLPLVRGDDPVGRLPTDHVRDRVPGAGILVAHGVSGSVPDWFREAVTEHPRVIHLPTGTEGARLASISPAQPRDGEWMPSPDLPPSPVGAYLAGLPLGSLPPLTDLRAPGAAAGAPVLLVRSPRGGESRPALVLREGAAGRSAVGLARGFWRWGHRSGDPREAYRGLWSGVAGWLLADDAPLAGAGEVRLLERVAALDEPLRWEVSGGAGQELELRFRAMEVEAEVRRVRLDAMGRGTSDPLPPGRWRWEGQVEVPPELSEGDPQLLSGAGEVEVEPWTGVLAEPPLDPVPESRDPAQAVAERAGRDGRPLRTHPAPYFLLVLLLCVEWVGRRRVGLR